MKYICIRKISVFVALTPKSTQRIVEQCCAEPGFIDVRLPYVKVYAVFCLTLGIEIKRIERMISSEEGQVEPRITGQLHCYSIGLKASIQ